MHILCIIACWQFLGLCKTPRMRHCCTPVHTYSRTALLNLRACQQSPIKPIGHSVWRTICELGLSTRGPTTRGCRGGTRKQRNIKIVVGNRPTSGFQHRTICPANLMSLPRRPHQCFSSCHDKPSNANDNYIDIDLLNPWSVCNKTNSIHDFIVDYKLDALALTETWLKGDQRDSVTIQELLPPGYKICQQARANRGGGVAVIYHSRLNIQNTPCSAPVHVI